MSRSAKAAADELLVPGNFFGEICMILSRRDARNEDLHKLQEDKPVARTASVCAATDCCIYELTADDAYATCEYHNVLEDF